MRLAFVLLLHSNVVVFKTQRFRWKFKEKGFFFNLAALVSSLWM